MNLSTHDARYDLRVFGAGPGVTSHFDVEITKQVDEDVTLEAPRGLQFQPLDQACQVMVCREHTPVTLVGPSGTVSRFTLPTVCGDAYGKLPPPADGSGTYVVPDELSHLLPVFDALDSSAEQLDLLADRISMPHEMYRSTVGQYAIWTLVAEATRQPAPEDAEVITSDARPSTPTLAQPTPGASAQTNVNWAFTCDPTLVVFDAPKGRISVALPLLAGDDDSVGGTVWLEPIGGGPLSQGRAQGHVLLRSDDSGLQVHLRITGLSENPEPIPLRVTNRTPQVVSLAGGDGSDSDGRV